MSFSPFRQQQTHEVTSTVLVEPIYHLLTAMSLLTTPNLDEEAEPWLINAAAKLTAEQHNTNRLIFNWFGPALLPTANYTTFTSYLTALENMSPADLVDRAKLGWGDDADAPADLLNDPPALHARVTKHLRTLWKTHFASEWEKKRSAMIYCADELNARNWPTESPRALLKAFIRGAIPDTVVMQLTGVRQINIVPSPYIGLHATRFEEPHTLWVFMLADFWRLPMRTEPIQRSEIKGPANALADETRLQILEMLAAHGEMRAQEIIAQMDTSQSTISRHLKQLSSTNFVSEKRADGANKIYQINRDRIDEFAYALSSLLSADNARLVLNDVRLDQPADLRPYLDRDGLVTNWPAKKKGQEAVLAYLAQKFTMGETYTEKQVNERLSTWHSYGNPAYLRRSLIDSGLLERTSTGSEYWLAEPTL